LVTSLLGTVVGAIVEPVAGGVTGVEEMAPDVAVGCLAGVVTAVPAGAFPGEGPPVIAACVSVAADVVLECFFFFVLVATDGGALVPGAEAEMGVVLVVAAALEPDAGAFCGVPPSGVLAVVELLCFFR
jgi:hypothetical protein